MGPTKPGENLFFRGLWGWATDTWERLQSTGGRLHTALHGYDGTNWQKLPMLWGYSDVYKEAKAEVGAAGGTRTLSGADVTAGEVWVVTSLTMINVTSNPTELLAEVKNNGTTFTFARVTAPGLGVPLNWSGILPMKNPENIQGRFVGTVAGDNLYMVWVGYKMKVG